MFMNIVLAIKFRQLFQELIYLRLSAYAIYCIVLSLCVLSDYKNTQTTPCCGPTWKLSFSAFFIFKTLPCKRKTFLKWKHSFTCFHWESFTFTIEQQAVYSDWLKLLGSNWFGECWKKSLWNLILLLRKCRAIAGRVPSFATPRMATSWWYWSFDLCWNLSPFALHGHVFKASGISNVHTSVMSTSCSQVNVG